MASQTFRSVEDLVKAYRSLMPAEQQRFLRLVGTFVFAETYIQNPM
jgi:hypothetical protein